MRQKERNTRITSGGSINLIKTMIFSPPDMNNDPSTSAPQTEPTPIPTSIVPPGIDDDIDFSDVQLAPRQQDANQHIVCEGGCE
jgi:hypothetical protein